MIENDSSYYAYRYPQTYLLPSLSSNDITAGITDGMHVFTPVAQGIVKGDSTDDLTLTTLLSTSSTAYSMQDYAEATTAEQGKNDPNGPFNIAVARQQQRYRRQSGLGELPQHAEQPDERSGFPAAMPSC